MSYDEFSLLRENAEPPDFMTLLAASIITGEDVDFGVPEPTAFLPVIPAWEAMVVADNAPFVLSVLDGTDWLPTGTDLQPDTNPQFPAKRALSGPVDAPGFYAVFVPDIDEDDIPDALDGDRDGDGIPDISDNCLETPNPDQSDADE